MSNSDSCSIYVIGPENGPYKIGFSSDPVSRLSNLQVSSPVVLKLHYSESTTLAKAKIIEKLIHRQLSHQRLRGEWFSIPLSDVISEVKFAFITYDGDEDLERNFRLKRI